MIAEYNVNLENKTKSELILFIKELQDMLKEKDREIEHQIEKRNNQKAELAILNKKQKEMNKLINTVKSYKGQIKRLEHTNRSYEGIISKQNKQIDLMAKYLAINGVERDICNEKRIKENCKNVTVDNITVHRCKECIKQYFKEIAERESEE